MKSSITAVIGASPNESRYSNIAIHRLTQQKHKIVALGFRIGKVADNQILTNWPVTIPNLKVVTLYLGPKRQPEFYDYILNLKPETVIFNPGTENKEFYTLLDQSGIKYEEACTLVLLSTGAYKNLL